MGKLDLAVTESGTRIVTVLLGRGDGTFQSWLDPMALEAIRRLYCLPMLITTIYLI